MPNLAAAEQAAIAAVAKHCSGTRRADDGAPGACLVIEGRTVAIDVVILDPGGSTPAQDAVPRLREDRVAQRVLRDLAAAVGTRAADGRAVVVTLGAPIILPNRLVGELATHLRCHLESGPVETDVRMDLLRNRVRLRVLRDGSPWRSPVNGFVFSGDPSPGDLAEAMRAMHDRILATTAHPARRRSSSERWLVLACGARIADGRTYRRALSLLSAPDPFAKTLLASPGGRVEILRERAMPEAQPREAMNP